LAHVVSQAASPPVLAAAVMWAAAASFGGLAAWAWATAHVGVAVAAPVLFLLRLRRAGRIEDLELTRRSERALPLRFTLWCGGLAWAGLAAAGAPRLLAASAGASWLTYAAIFAITTRWKISVHCATAAGAAMLAWSLGGTALPLALGVPLMAWSRLRLRRHTPAQAIAGAALGAALFAAALAWAR
jgi:membrane-associated phospholipid phosphatase